MNHAFMKAVAHFKRLEGSTSMPRPAPVGLELLQAKLRQRVARWRLVLARAMAPNGFDVYRSATLVQQERMAQLIAYRLIHTSHFSARYSRTVLRLARQLLVNTTVVHAFPEVPHGR